MKRFLAILALALTLPLAAWAAEDGWVDLFDGKTLNGWKQHNGTAKYEVKDGMIVGHTSPSSPNSFLCTEKDFGDFELEFDVKVDPGLNSGVQLRSRERGEKDVASADPEPVAGKKALTPAGVPVGENKAAAPAKGEKKTAKAKGEKKAAKGDKKKAAAKGDKAAAPKGQKKAAPANANQSAGRVFGPQVEIASGGAEGSLSGYIYGEAMGSWRTVPEKLKPHPYFKNDDWNHFRVVAKGPRIQVWINGHEIEDLTDEAIYKTHPKGFLSLQVHGVGDAGPFQVAWKNLKIRELK